jgi:DNA-binding NarL/FixJ family response regulator
MSLPAHISQHGDVAQRVLVVDDEPDLRRLLRWLLELDERCDGIAEADDSESALREAARLVPHAVILDFMLGDTTADEVLPALRLACPQARIVVYTAAPERAEAAGVIGQGADAVAAKAGGSIDDIIDLVLLPATSSRA